MQITGSARRRTWLIALAMATSLAALLSPLSPATPERASAAVGDGSSATMADYWSGAATWVFQRKNTQTTTGDYGWYEGGSVRVGPDNAWYYFSRTKLTTAAGCAANMGVQVRKSTDQGATWSAPTQIIAPTIGTPWSCIATDGSAWYNPTENAWHYLFQCNDGTTWQGCDVQRSGSNPMGTFTSTHTQPSVTPGQLWNSICNVSADDCSTIPGGVGLVHDEGTFDIFKFDGTYYWVAFHGYDGVNGYRGIAKTTNFTTWIAGDPAQGVPNDSVFDRNDSQPWRETWSGGQSIGGGAGTIFTEGSQYYQLVEAGDMNLGCINDQRWDEGFYRSTSLTSTSWDSYPQGNPIVYSSRTPEESGGLTPPCSVQYATVFRDPTTGFIWMSYGRVSHFDPNTDGRYWFRLEKTHNLLVNSDFWRADFYGWNRILTATNYAVYRFPGDTPDGTPFAATNCGGTCTAASGIYQDVAVPAGSSGTINYGGDFRSIGGSGTFNLVAWQLDNTGAPLASSTVVVNTTGSWATQAGSTALVAGAVTIRYQMYLNTGSVTFELDDTYVKID